MIAETVAFQTLMSGARRPRSNPTWGIRVTLAGIALVVGVALLGGGAHAHGGGLDSEGCHVESATGERHCHGAGSSGAGEDNRQGGEYDRDDYGGWRDLDGDCQTMRDEVLIDTAKDYRLDSSGCDVVAGRWIGPYTGELLTNVSDVHIDHIVPLAEAHRSGAAEWRRTKKQRFANDPANLTLSKGAVNMSKGADDPADWLPERSRCAYIERWVSVKREYGLSMDQAERAAVRRVQGQCQSP